MVEYSKVNAKLTDTKLKKLKTAVKKKAETTLRMTLKMFDGNDLRHELLMTARQKTNLRNPFNNNMSTDIKLSKAQIPKITQSGVFWGSFSSKLAGPLMKVAVPLAKNVLAPSGITITASVIDAGIQKKKKNTRFWKNKFNNFKRRNEWHSENRATSWIFCYFVEKSH